MYSEVGNASNHSNLQPGIFRARTQRSEVHAYGLTSTTNIARCDIALEISAE